MSSKLLKMNVFKPYSVYNVFSSARSVAASAIERHYLQFDGLVDYAVADAVFGGISGDYTIAIKVAGRNASGSASAETLCAVGGATGSISARQSRYDWVYGTTSTSFYGIDPSSGLDNYSATAAAPADTDRRVFAVKRAAAGGAGGAKCRLVAAGGVEYTSDKSAAMFTADHISIGARVNNALAVTASTYGAVQLIGLVLASVQIPDAELQAWLNATTAVGNITGIDHYWVASDINGASIPARIGTVALSLSGPTSSDLVAWAP